MVTSANVCRRSSCRLPLLTAFVVQTWVGLVYPDRSKSFPVAALPTGTIHRLSVIPPFRPPPLRWSLESLPITPGPEVLQNLTGHRSPLLTCPFLEGWATSDPGRYLIPAPDHSLRGYLPSLRVWNVFTQSHRGGTWPTSRCSRCTTCGWVVPRSDSFPTSSIAPSRLCKIKPGSATPATDGQSGRMVSPVPKEYGYPLEFAPFHHSTTYLPWSGEVDDIGKHV